MAKNELPIIDMHLHCYEEFNQFFEMWDEIIKQYPIFGQLPTAKSPESLLKDTLAKMGENNIIKGFLSGSVECVYQWVGAAPDRFIASPGIGGNPIEPSIDFLRKEYKTNKLDGMGEIGTQYAGIRPNDPRLEPYFALAVELDLPVHIHTCGGGAAIPTFRLSAGRPLLLEEVLLKQPALRLFVENAGYPFLDEIKAIMRHFPQLYSDLSTITWIIPREEFHDYLQSLIKAGFGKRLLFGSDQMIWPDAIDIAVESIMSATFLNEQQKRDILYNNAMHFLKSDNNRQASISS